MMSAPVKIDKEVLRDQRKKLSLTQSQLAAALGVGATTVRAWESGRANPNPTLLPQIADLLKINTAELLVPGQLTLSRLRRQKGLKQATVAHDLKITQGMLSAIERGEINPTEHLLSQLGGIYQLSLAEIKQAWSLAHTEFRQEIAQKIAPYQHEHR